MANIIFKRGSDDLPTAKTDGTLYFHTGNGSISLDIEKENNQLDRITFSNWSKTLKLNDNSNVPAPKTTSTLGTPTYKWAKLYIGSNASYGSD